MKPKGRNTKTYHGPGLTLKEQTVMKWVAMGKSNPEIGQILGISPSTVKGHVQRILQKVNVSNRAQAVAIFGMPWLFEK